MNPRPGPETSRLPACSRLPARAFAEKINQPLHNVALLKRLPVGLYPQSRGKDGNHSL
jgi:hypothetical protein